MSANPLPEISNNCRIWFENTKSSHKHGGEGWELGTCLWSPSKDRGGKDWYASMRSVEPGDLVLNVSDNYLHGTSIVASPCTERSDEPPHPGDWANMAPYYRIDLREYSELTSPLLVDQLLQSERDSIAEAVERMKRENGYARAPFHFSDGTEKRLKFAQTYLTECSPDLYGIIRDWANQQNDPTFATTTQANNEKLQRTQYWAIALGEQGRLWDQCQEEGLIRIGWDFLGDLRNYPTRESIAEKMRASRKPNEPEPSNDSLACFEFANSMQQGDYVVAKIGRSKLLGLGVIEGDYEYDPSRHEYHHVRQVRWIKVENLESPKEAHVPIKTLTDCTNFRAFVDFVTENWIESDTSLTIVESKEPYSIEDALEDCFLPQIEFESIVDALQRKKNVVLQGSPGVGKTFLARRLAYALIEQKDPERAPIVQFHQSYAYEDFIQGFRPSTGKSPFQRQDGLFLNFCNRARKDRERPYVFIIDEINRGNLSKIFGELMMLIESDKRGSEYAIRLTYATPDDPPFSVPTNVHLLGLMNTADRSLAMVDYALRRRFVFFTLAPQFQSESFQNFLSALGARTVFVERIVERLTRLNAEIRSDKVNLGEGFVVGHSYFCPEKAPRDWDQWYRNVIQYEVGPLLQEYWFDDSIKADEWIDELLKQ